MPIQEEEIREAVKKFKKGKVADNDHILNEHIATTLHIFMPTYVFNIYESGIVPEDWLIGLIKPLYKNKGDPMKPENYRPITLLSCQIGNIYERN